LCFRTDADIGHARWTVKTENDSLVDSGDSKFWWTYDMAVF